MRSFFELIILNTWGTASEKRGEDLERGTIMLHKIKGSPKARLIWLIGKLFSLLFIIKFSFSS